MDVRRSRSSAVYSFFQGDVPVYIELGILTGFIGFFPSDRPEGGFCRVCDDKYPFKILILPPFSKLTNSVNSPVFYIAVMQQSTNYATCGEFLVPGGE